MGHCVHKAQKERVSPYLLGNEASGALWLHEHHSIIVQKSKIKGCWVWVAEKAGQERNGMEEHHIHLFLPSYSMGALGISTKFSGGARLR